MSKNRSLRSSTLHFNRKSTIDTSYADVDQLGWRSIIFTPFGDVWQIALMLSIFVNSFTVIYIWAYGVKESDEAKFEGLYYALELMYFLDTILFLMHRAMISHRVIRDHEPRSSLTLTVDLLTLLPIYEVYLLLTYLSRQASGFPGRRYIRIKSVIRLYRIFSYFRKVRATAASNQVWLIVLEQFFAVTMSVHVLGAIWFGYSCWKCEIIPNWTETISEYHVFDSNSPFDWFVFSYGTMGNLFLHNYKAEIYGVIIMEKFLFISTMFLGHLMHYMFFVGNLIVSNVNSQRRHHNYVSRLKNIKTVLRVWRIDEKLKNLTLNYYDKLWDRYSGIKYMPKAFNLLPTPLKKEVMLDLFWDALNHSYLFQHEDTAFKRALSLEMKSEFYQQGDYVVEINQFKTKMYYISSGVLEVPIPQHLITSTDDFCRF